MCVCVCVVVRSLVHTIPLIQNKEIDVYSYIEASHDAVTMYMRVQGLLGAHAVRGTGVESLCKTHIKSTSQRAPALLEHCGVNTG